MLKLFQKEDSGSFSHDKTITILQNNKQNISAIKYAPKHS
jgi:hypothetical protein